MRLMKAKSSSSSFERPDVPTKPCECGCREWLRCDTSTVWVCAECCSMIHTYRKVVDRHFVEE